MENFSYGGSTEEAVVALEGNMATIKSHRLREGEEKNTWPI